ncbi:MAG: hypothetical protein ACFFCW_30855 [Candidatus Hodarchaeota archaeon]
MVAIYQITSVVEILIAIALTLGFVFARTKKTPEGIRIHHLVMTSGIFIHTIVSLTWFIPQFLRAFPDPPSNLVFHATISSILLIFALYQVIRGIIDTRILGKIWIRQETVHIHSRLGYLILMLYYFAVFGGISFIYF